MVEKRCVFFSVCKCAEDFFKTPIYLMYHCCVNKSYKIILNYKVLEFLVNYYSIRFVYYTITDV